MSTIHGTFSKRGPSVWWASARDGILEVRTPIKEATKAEPKRIAITKE